MLSSHVKKINSNGIRNLAIDIDFILQHIKSLKDPNLLDAFAELEQYIAFLESDHYLDYMDRQLRNKRYSLLKPSSIVIIMEK